MLCPKCGQPLGLVRAEIAQVGALLHHDRAYCGAVLIVVASASPAEPELRIATEEEKSRAQKNP